MAGPAPRALPPQPPCGGGRGSYLPVYLRLVAVRDRRCQDLFVALETVAVHRKRAGLAVVLAAALVSAACGSAGSSPNATSLGATSPGATSQSSASRPAAQFVPGP